MKEPIKYGFAVSHPVYGNWRGAAVDSGEALTLAADHWGVRWTEIAGECVITKGGKAVVLHCRRCNGPIFQGPPQSRQALWGEEEQGSGANPARQGGASRADFATTKDGALCAACQEQEALRRRETARAVKPRDRRARYAH